jgi:hypothetical protein
MSIDAVRSHSVLKENTALDFIVFVSKSACVPTSAFIWYVTDVMPLEGGQRFVLPIPYHQYVKIVKRFKVKTNTCDCITAHYRVSRFGC